jgi:pyridoxine 5-phosphate synthase
MTKLSVNLNKVALLRNQRDIGYPDLLDHAKLILESGAHGLTVHPRPDERHVRKSDVKALSDFLENWPDKEIELNIEGYPGDEFIDLVLSNRCHQVTLVPDDPHQRTSDHGWDISGNREMLTKVISKLKNRGRRVSLFMDPVPELISKAETVGADRVELYTGPYAEGYIPLEHYTNSAIAAREAGLDVNAGHDLNLDNLARFIAAVPYCEEVSIGHAITADALKMGWPAAVQAYRTAIDYGHKKTAVKAEQKKAG